MKKLSLDGTYRREIGRLLECPSRCVRVLVEHGRVSAEVPYDAHRLQTAKIQAVHSVLRCVHQAAQNER